MTLGPGSRIGPYEIQAPLGAGGMGEVFRARDTKLGRDAAIKVLPAEFARDAERVARFRREAQILASLNHPNIAAIYGIEESEGLLALAMEHVDGEDIAQRLARGAIPVDDASAIAKQIAEALEEAHEHGIVHRDLKPANVKLTAEGKVKVLDFGLAKTLEGEAGTHGAPIELSHSPTLTHQGTVAGVILGTAAYMSPEQARGKRVDKRADIWSFGVVLYEMLSGKRLFSGETVSDTLAAVLRQDIDWSALPAGTPRALRGLLERCIDRDPRLRLRDIGEARVALANPHGASAEPAERTPWNARIAFVAALALLAAGALLGRWTRRDPPAPPPEARLSILPPPLGLAPYVDPAVSPDGRSVVFVANGPSATQVLWVRHLDAPAPRAVDGTEGARLPFWSPDGKWIGFFAGGKLKKAPVSGGSSQVLADAPGGRGGTWNARGDILFSPTAFVPIHRTTAGGSTATQLVLSGETPGPIKERRTYPRFLPDGRHFLFSRAFSIVVGELDSPVVREVLPVASMAEYANGRLYFVRDGDLFAQRFDVGRLAVEGEAIKVADNIGFPGDAATGFAFSVSASGVLAFYDRNRTDPSQLTWFDGTGRRLGTVGEPGEYLGLALSPDEQRIAVEVHEPRGGTVSVWLIDARNGTRSRFARYKNWTGVPLWSADSKRLLVTDFSDRWHVLPIEGGPAQEIEVGAGVKWPTSWSADGRHIVFDENRETQDIGLLDTTGGAPRAYLQTAFDEYEPRISPDGAWLVHETTETGRPEVYLQSFPVPGRKLRVSTSGGADPAWHPDGRAVFYVAASGDLVEVELAFSSGAVSVQATRTLFRPPPTSYPESSRRQFEVSKDGKRFLFNAIVPDASPRAISVILGWKPDAR